VAGLLTSHTRLVALVAMLAASGVAAGIFVLTRSTDSAASPTVPVTRAGVLPTASQPGPPRARAKRATPRPKPAVAANGLPSAIATALTRHRVVVVSLYASDGVVDGIARREAAAGAREVGAGFVAVNALDRRRSEPLALRTGVVEAPSTLVFRRPAKLVMHIDGYADRVSVAQAAANAGA
jgi:hypothetical protein